MKFSLLFQEGSGWLNLQTKPEGIMNAMPKLGRIAAVIFCLNPLLALASPPVITSIQRVDGCTTLTWTSVPGEFYAVYWTDTLGPNAWWRVAAMHVPAEGGGVPVRLGLNVVAPRP